jgi:hypothetical protein
MSGAEEEPREATQMAEAQDEAQPSAVEEWSLALNYK